MSSRRARSEPPKIIGAMAALCSRAVELQKRVNDLEAELEQASSELDEQLRITLPEALAEVGLAEVLLEDGTRLKLEPFVRAKIPGGDEEDSPGAKSLRRRAFDWVREDNSTDMIKTHIQVWYSKGQDAQAQAVVEALQKLGAPVEYKEDIHHSTLRSYVKKCVEAGKPIPLDAFGAYVGTTTKITPPKETV